MAVSLVMLGCSCMESDSPQCTPLGTNVQLQLTAQCLQGFSQECCNYQVLLVCLLTSCLCTYGIFVIDTHNTRLHVSVTCHHDNQKPSGSFWKRVNLEFVRQSTNTWGRTLTNLQAKKLFAAPRHVHMVSNTKILPGLPPLMTSATAKQSTPEAIMAIVCKHVLTQSPQQRGEYGALLLMRQVTWLNCWAVMINNSKKLVYGVCLWYHKLGRIYTPCSCWRGCNTSFFLDTLVFW